MENVKYFPKHFSTYILDFPRKAFPLNTSVKFGVFFSMWLSFEVNAPRREGASLTTQAEKQLSILSCVSKKRGEKSCQHIFDKRQENDRLFGVCKKFFLSYILTARGGLLLRIWVKLLPVSAGTHV